MTIYFTINSGKIYYRNKINTLTGIKHPGIFLGIDINGVEYFLHNHYHIGKAAIVTGDEFKSGQPLFLYNEFCTNSPLQVIQIGLLNAQKGESYHFLKYNCQTYTNLACHNKNESQDVIRIGRQLLFGTILFLGFNELMK